MPYLFHKQQGRWIGEPMPALPAQLFLAPLRVVPAAQAADEGSGASAILMHTPMHTRGSAQAGHWVMLVAPGQAVLHNGQPVSAGLRVLDHRDSLGLAGKPCVFFSTEEAPRVETFTGADPVTCPRCRDAIAPGQPAVKCPGCGVLHHENGERNCWTYATTCALCAQPTALDAGLQWTPEAL